MLVFTKTVSSWVRKVLSPTKAYMSPGTLEGAVVLAVIAAGISLVFILQAGDWASVSTTARHSFLTCITTTDQQQDSIQPTILGLSE